MTTNPDRVKESTSTTGTGNLVLLGAQSQHQAISAAFNVGTSNIKLAIVGQGTGEWEISSCTLVDSTHISRDTVMSSSNGGALVNFSAGTKDVFFTLDGAELIALKANKITPAPIVSAPSASTHLAIEDSGAVERIGLSDFAALIAPYITAVAVNLGAPSFTGHRTFASDVFTGNPAGFATTFNKGYGAVTFALTAAVAASGITLQVRLRDAADGVTLVQDWLTISAVTSLSAGSNNVTLNIPASNKYYNIDFRVNGATPATVANPIGVGLVIAAAGQSLASDLFANVWGGDTATLASLGLNAVSSGTVYAPYLEQATATASTYITDTANWNYPRDSTTGPTVKNYNSSFAAEFISKVSTKAGVVVALVGHAIGGTNINTWYNGSTLQVALKAVLDGIQKFNAFIWVQGHADTSLAGLPGSYQTALTNLFNALAAYQGAGGTAGNFYRLICSIPSATTAVSNPKGQAQVRSAALAYVGTDTKAAYVDGLDVTLADGTHPSMAGNVKFADDFYRALMMKLGLLTSTSTGPTITSASRSAGSAVINVTVAQHGGSALVAQPNAATALNQFKVYTSPTTYDGSGNANNESWTVTGMTIASATQIQLTISTTGSASTALADSIALDLWYRLGPDSTSAISSGIFDDVTDADGLSNGRQLRLVASATNVAAPAVETITVTTPGNQTAGVAFTLNGTYANATPTALDYSLDSGSTWNAASSPTISGGNYSFSLTIGTANASQTVKVRDHSTLVTGTSGTFSVASAQTITVNTPTTQTAGTAFTLSGTYANGTPTALDYSLDSGSTWTAAGSPTISGGNYSFSLTISTANASQTVRVRDHATLVYGTSGTFAVNASGLILDQLSATAVAGYSMSRKIRNAYAGKAFQLSDHSGTLTDIGFDGSGNVDATAIAAAATAAASQHTWVSKIYDQVGSADLTQATNGNQWDFTNSNTVGTRASPNNRSSWKPTSNYTPAAIVSGAVSLTVAAASAVITGGVQASNAGVGCVTAGTATTPFYAPSTTGGALASKFGGSAAANLKVNGSAGTTMPTSGANSLYADGTSVTATAVKLGVDNANTGGWVGDICEFILFNAALSSGDQTTLYNNQKTYFGTP